MNFLDSFSLLPIDQQVEVIKKLKLWAKNRNKFLMEQGSKIYKEHTKDIKKENGWSVQKTMKKRFSIPMDVYMADSSYWDEIIKTKQFKKHPEWVVGN